MGAYEGTDYDIASDLAPLADVVAWIRFRGVI